MAETSRPDDVPGPTAAVAWRVFVIERCATLGVLVVLCLTSEPLGSWLGRQAGNWTGPIVAVSAVFALVAARLSSPVWGRLIANSKPPEYASADHFCSGMSALTPIGLAVVFVANSRLGIASGVLLAVLPVICRWLVARRIEGAISGPVAVPLPAAAERLLAESGFARTDVLEKEMFANTPACLVACRHSPRILLAPTQLRAFADSEVTACIAHELGHYRYRRIDNMQTLAVHAGCLFAKAAAAGAI
ncbi:MAG: hypothetical protein HQ546_04955, partial [Planctomycetes bacterium]|nr:hypothetical protein [Planctomycetota bacterium]